VGTIRVLSTDVVNKIAAGEVIERPASIAKELLENAVDAGAGRIDVEVEQGGRALVRVSDNGRGIAPEEVALAFMPHATSKLAGADDLFHIETLGFRGEALASIGSVAQCALRSRTADQPTGRQVHVDGGRLGEVTECGGPPGTVIEVRRLFYNTPVRRKFMRTVQTEMSHIVESFTRIALAHPEIQMTLRHNGKEVFELPAHDQLPQRLALFFGRELADALLPIEVSGRGITLRGYVARPTQSRASGNLQYLFLNGRYIRDRQCLHAVREAYRGLLMTGRQPIVFLFLEMDPGSVDVNVHPTKIEVRFRDGSLVYSTILSGIRQKFLQSDLQPTLDAPAAPAGQGSVPPSGTAAEDAERQERLRASIADYFRKPPPETVYPSRGPVGPLASPAPSVGDRTAMPTGPAIGPAVEHGPVETDLPRKVMQVHDRYLVVETPEGILIVDQHALHERILYERIRSRFESGSLESQRLLVPEPIDLPGPLQAVLDRERETLSRLGLEVEPFGTGSAAVHAYPSLLGSGAIGPLVSDLLDRLAQSGSAPDRRTLLEELMQMIACKAAIKAGERLGADEIRELLAQRDLIADAHHCPHGRPASLLLTAQDLERQFKRT